jgi:hypothetical protein
MAVPHLTGRHGQLATRPFHASKAHRRIGLVWRASFPGSGDLEVFGRFVQSQLPDTVAPIVDAASAAPQPSRRSGRRATPG